MKRTILQKAAAAALFVLLTAALLAAADFLLVDDVHSYSRVMLQELYADAGNIDTLFLGSSHCYRSVDPAQVDAALGTHSFNAGSSQQLPDGSYYMLKEAAAQNPLKTVYLEMFYTGYNESASANIPLACYLLADHMDWRSPNRYAYLSEMGGLAAYADLLLHVVDISHPDFEEQIKVVDNTLKDLGCADKPSMIIFNKIDSYTWVEKDPDDLTPATKENVTLDELKKTWMAKLNDSCLFISAKNKTNIDELRETLYNKVRELHVQKYPYNDFLYPTE